MELQKYKLNRKTLFVLAFAFLFLILLINSFLIIFVERGFERQAVLNEAEAVLDSKLALEHRMRDELNVLRIEKQAFFSTAEKITDDVYETLKTKIDGGLDPSAALRQLSRVSNFNSFYYFYHGELTLYEGGEETAYIITKDDALALLYESSPVRLMDIDEEEFAAVFVPQESMIHAHGEGEFRTDDGREIFLYAVGEDDFRIEVNRGTLLFKKWREISGGLEIELKTLPYDKAVFYEATDEEGKSFYTIYLYAAEEYNCVLGVYGDTAYRPEDVGILTKLHQTIFDRQWFAMITSAAIAVGVMLFLIRHVDKKYLTKTFRSARRLEEAKDEAKSEYRNLYNEVNHDVLTGIYNRGFTDVYLSDLFHNRGEFFSCIMGDIDDFKKINDSYGHEAGDKVLKEIAVIANKNLRNKDVFSRWGGEEFLIVIKFLNLEEVSRIAGRIKDDIEKNNFVYGDLIIKLTMSFGIACFRDSDSDYTDIIIRADKALYRSKALGKNMITMDA